MGLISMNRLVMLISQVLRWAYLVYKTDNHEAYDLQLNLLPL